jgi:hypothetical protein
MNTSIGSRPIGARSAVFCIQSAACPRLAIRERPEGSSKSQSHLPAESTSPAALPPVAGFPGLLAVKAADCNLHDGKVHHYWFEAEDSDRRRDPAQRVLCSDPLGWTVD